MLKGIIFDETRWKYTALENNSANVISRILGIKIINRAKMGCTVTKGMELLTKDLQCGADCQAAIIEFGGNDSDFNWSTISENPEENHLPKTPLSSFCDHICNMITLIRKANITPVLMNLPPIDSERYFDFISRGLNAQNILKWLGEKDVIYRFHENYSKSIEQIAKSENCLLLDIRSAFLEQNDFRDYLCTDGIHPNEKGHQLMQGVFLKYAGSIG